MLHSALLPSPLLAPSPFCPLSPPPPLPPTQRHAHLLALDLGPLGVDVKQCAAGAAQRLRGSGDGLGGNGGRERILGQLGGGG